jgi:Ras-related C3 botulinum toxin substrate 1
LNPISTSKAENMKKMVPAQLHIECSAKTQYNVKEVFEAVINVVLHPPSEESIHTKQEAKGRCCIVA